MIYMQLMQSTIDNAILISEQIKTSQKSSSLLKVYLPKKDEEGQQAPKKKKLFQKLLFIWKKMIMNKLLSANLSEK